LGNTWLYSVAVSTWDFDNIKINDFPNPRFEPGYDLLLLFLIFLGEFDFMLDMDISIFNEQKKSG
jgi:hypothetical protein